MKRISVLLGLLSCITATYNSFTTQDFTQDTPDQKYDIKKAARKFRKKHGKPKIDPHFKRYHYEYSCITEDEELKSWAEDNAKTRNKILYSIEEHGSEAIHSDKMGTDYSKFVGGSGELDVLSIAVESNYIPLVKFLLQHGANPNKGTVLHSWHGKSGMQYKTYYPIERIRTPEMAQFLEENGTDLSPLFNEPANILRIKNDPDLCEYVEKKKAEYHNLNQRTLENHEIEE